MFSPNRIYSKKTDQCKMLYNSFLKLVHLRLHLWKVTVNKPNPNVSVTYVTLVPWRREWRRNGQCDWLMGSRWEPNRLRVLTKQANDCWRWYKRRACLNAHQFSQPRPYSGGTATMATGRYVSVPCRLSPCPSRDPVVKLTLKRSHMKQSERRESGCGSHMPQEPLKVFQWNRPLALESLQAFQHRLNTLYWETCCEVDRVQLHADQRDPLRRGEFALFPGDLKPQPAEVTEHRVPVFAQ